MAAKFPEVQTQRELLLLDKFLFFYSEGSPLWSGFYNIMTEFWVHFTNVHSTNTDHAPVHLLCARHDLRHRDTSGRDLLGEGADVARVHAGRDMGWAQSPGTWRSWA